MIPPVPTPFGEDGEVDLGAFRENLGRWVEAGLTGILVLGSNGEAPYLEAAEKLALIRTARGVIPPDRFLLVGTGMESTRATVRLTCQAAELGADFALVLPPSYYRIGMTPEVLRAHFQAVAAASPIPLLYYHVPQFTGLDPEVEVLLSLLALDGVLGMKDSAGDRDRVARTLGGLPHGRSFLVGSAPLFSYALRLGAAGGILAVANVAPTLCLALFQAAREGRHEQAEAMQERLTPLAKAVTEGYGAPGLKAALDLLGYAGGLPRPPLLPLSGEGRQAITRLLRDLDLLDP